MAGEKHIHLVERTKATRIQRVGASLLLSAGAFVAGLYLYAGYLNYFAAESKNTVSDSAVAGDSVPYPATYHDHSEYRGSGGVYQTRNLLTEDSSFEVGMRDSFDAVSVMKRLHYDHYNPGSGDLFSDDVTKGYIRPEISSEQARYGSRSLKIDNRNADGAFIDFNWIRAPQTGKYVVSLWLKAENVGGQVDNDTNCTNTTIFTNVQVIDKDYTTFLNVGDHHVVPGAWVRKWNPTVADLQAGELYRIQFRISNTERPMCAGKGTLYIDAVQLEYAEDQEDPQPTEYTYPTSQQELYAYTSAEAVGAQVQDGNLFYREDGENMYAHIQVWEEGNLAPASKLKWYLYDMYGDSNNTSTALDEGSVVLSHSANQMQTQHLDLSSILASAAPTKIKGVYKMVVELWNPTETEMVDKEFLMFGILERSPYAFQDKSDSFFGNHLFMLWANSTYDRSTIEAGRPPSYTFQLAKNIGVHSSREFYLLNQDNIENHYDVDPFMIDYVTAAAQKKVSLLPVIPPKGGWVAADQGWQDFVSASINAYGASIPAFEVLNEPDDSFGYLKYYGYLSRAEEAIHSVQPEVNVVGPSSSGRLLDDLLSYDGGSGRAYDLFDRMALHNYFRYSEGLRNIPELGNGWGDSIDAHYDGWYDLLDEHSPTGQNTKISWVTEFGMNHGRLYDDVPVIFGGLWESPVDQWPHMSGSIPLGAQLAGDFVRYHMYQFAQGVQKTYYFGLTSTRIIDGTTYAQFDFDSTPIFAASAYAQMTRMLEGSNYIRRIETTDLRTNGALNSTNRAFVFEIPDLAHPGQMLPMAAVFNWDQTQSGAALQSIPLATSDVSVVDLEGNPIVVPSGSSFSLSLNSTPKYIIGNEGVTLSDLVYALDDTRPTTPLAPSAVVEGEQIRVFWNKNPETDIQEYQVLRRPSGSSTDELVATVDAGRDMAAYSYRETPPPGLWIYRIKAVEEGTGFQTASSGPSFPVSTNYAPLMAEIGNQSGQENVELSFEVSATDPDIGDPIELSVSGNPTGSTFVDHGDGTGTFSWVPSFQQSGAHTNVVFTASDTQAADTETITITVENVNQPPTIVAITDKTIHEGDLLEFTVIGQDEDLEDGLSLRLLNAPNGAILTDHENRTGTFRWRPESSQSGSYLNIEVRVTDSAETMASELFNIVVEDGLSNCMPNWSCTEWGLCSSGLQTRTCSDLNNCGTDGNRPIEIRACDSITPERIDNLFAG